MAYGVFRRYPDIRRWRKLSPALQVAPTPPSATGIPATLFPMHITRFQPLMTLETQQATMRVHTETAIHLSLFQESMQVEYPQKKMRIKATP